MTPLIKPDAILFDWDGTLVDTIDVLLQGYNDVFKYFGMPEWDLEEGKKNIRTSSRETFPTLFGDRSDEAIQIYYESVEKNHLQYLNKMEGADQFLAALKNKNIPMGIISNKRDILLKKEVEYLGWNQYFSAIIGAGRAAKDKPAPDCMTLAVNEMALPVKILELWYVGDTETDMEFAANTGARKIFISHGFGTLENAEKYDPDWHSWSLEHLGKELDRVFNLL